jgi:hypothetical protein
MAGEPQQPGGKNITKTFDLTTLGLTGSHTITVKARASGYADSEPSNAVSYVVAGDTVQVSGTWRFNDIPEPASQRISESCDFTTESGYSVHLITISDSATTMYRVAFAADGKSGYEVNRGWDAGCQVITFDGVQTVSRRFYNWLTANATQTHCLLHAGTYVLKDKPNDDYNYDIYGEFVSNGQTFTRIDAAMDMVGSLNYYKSDGNLVQVYHVDRGWANTAYKTMVFANDVLVEKHAFDTFMTDIDDEKSSEDK